MGKKFGRREKTISFVGGRKILLHWSEVIINPSLLIMTAIFRQVAMLYNNLCMVVMLFQCHFNK